MIDIYEATYISIVLYFNLYQTDICHRYLSKEICCWPRITLWNVSHFVIYAVLGVFYPENRMMYICLGILWECFEFTVGIYDTKRGRAYWTSGGIGGQMTDIVANILGLSFGAFCSP